MSTGGAGWAEPVETACAFVTVQSAWLRRGLLAAPDERARAVALAVHERGHERWLGIIADAPDAACAQALVDLYALHGRIAELLDGDVPGAGADAVRRILAERMTVRARAVLRRLRSTRHGPVR